MNATNDIHDLIVSLKEAGKPFAIATVVRTLSVTSAKAGAKAVVQADGTISEGWIGGGCARAAVIKAAKEAIEGNTPRLVSIQPEELLDDLGVSPGEEKDGIKFAKNMCPSQGTMDIFVEPVSPRPELIIFGDSPVAHALTSLGSSLGFSITVCDRELPEQKQSDSYIVVATQGKGDEQAVHSAMASSAQYIAFVGSRKKAENLKTRLKERGVPQSNLDALKAPAGLDIKAITPEEIALSILAEIVQLRRTSQRDVTLR